MSDWLDVMLEEIERKKQERREAEEEALRREANADNARTRRQEK